MAKKLAIPIVYFGCDPELFFTNNDEVVMGAEKVIPHELPSHQHGKFVLDGVQIELNPAPAECRETLGSTIKQCFYTLHDYLRNIKDVKVSFRSVVNVSKAELDSLSDQAKVFGCAPSFNFYDKEAAIAVDPRVYLKRSAGGHIHLGFDKTAPQMMAIRERLVPLMDVFVGNTCVMVDRDPEAPERRKVYGRAGEHRLPDHGLEYRTLSNFWLRSYQLMSMVMGLSRIAASILYTSQVVSKSGNANSDKWYKESYGAEEDLLSRVDLLAVRDAINNNDIGLARKNFQAVKGFVTDYSFHGISLDPSNIKAFEYFSQVIEQKGIEHWFPLDPLKHWSDHTNRIDNNGWESFLDTTVRREMVKSEQEQVRLKEEGAV